VTTDEVRAEIDTAGGILSRLELLNEHEKDGAPVVLLNATSIAPTWPARA
jgi:YidC/Oxa1 family membrane protein insertase